MVGKLMLTGVLEVLAVTSQLVATSKGNSIPVFSEVHGVSSFQREWQRGLQTNGVRYVLRSRRIVKQVTKNVEEHKQMLACITCLT